MRLDRLPGRSRRLLAGARSRGSGPGAGSARSSQAQRRRRPSESYYLALGDSIDIRASSRPRRSRGLDRRHFTTGYVDVVAARLRKRSSSLEVVNYGCPGRVARSPSPEVGCPAFADRVKLHDASSSGSQLEGGARPSSALTRDDVSPITTDAVRQRLASGRCWTRARETSACARKHALRATIASFGSRLDVDHPAASSGRADGRHRRDGSVESATRVSSRQLESDLPRSLEASIARAATPSHARIARMLPGLQSARESAVQRGTALRAHLHLLEGRSRIRPTPGTGRWPERRGACGLSPGSVTMSAIASTSTATPGLCGTRPASSIASSRLAQSTT